MRIKNGFLIGQHVSVIVATDMLSCMMEKPESKCVSISKFAHFTLFYISHKSPQVSVKALSRMCIKTRRWKPVGNLVCETRHFSPFHQDHTIVCLELLIVKTILILTKVSNFSKQALFIRGWGGWHVGNGRFWVSSRILKRIIGFTSHPKGLLSVQSVMVLRASPRPWQTHF